MIKDTSKQMAKVAVEALKEKKGYDVKVIDISEISILADYFIIATTMLRGFFLTIMTLCFMYLMKRAAHSIILKDYGEMVRK